MANDPNRKVELIKKALFGDIIQRQILDKTIETHQKKTCLKTILPSPLTHKYKIWRLWNKAITYKKMDLIVQNMKLSEKERELKKSYTSFMKMTIIVVVRQEKKNASLAKKIKNKDIFWIPWKTCIKNFSMQVWWKLGIIRSANCVHFGLLCLSLQIVTPVLVLLMKTLIWN